MNMKNSNKNEKKKEKSQRDDNPPSEENIPKANLNFAELEKSLYVQFSGAEKDWSQWKQNILRIMHLRNMQYLLKSDFNLNTGNNTQQKDKRAANRGLFVLLNSLLDNANAEKITKAYDNDGIAAWKYITSLYEKSESFEAVNLIKALVNIKFNGNMKEYIDTHNAVFSKLNIIFGADVFNDPIICSFLLAGLPQQLQNFMQQKHLDTKQFKVAEFERDLLSVRSEQIIKSNSNNEVKNEIPNSNSSIIQSESALFSRSNNDFRSSNQGSKKRKYIPRQNQQAIQSEDSDNNSNRWCYICDDSNHTTKKCW